MTQIRRRSNCTNYLRLQEDFTASSPALHCLGHVGGTTLLSISHMEDGMKVNKFCSVGVMALVVIASVIPALAQNPKQLKLRGLINDFTPSTVGGPWEIRGDWTLKVNFESGKAYFSAALTMERSDQGVVLNGGGEFTTPAGRHAHVHHVTLTDADIVPLPNGFRITGTATVAGNGGPPPDFAPSSPIQIDITGGSLVPFSNMKLSFGSPASGHFGTSAFNGVVRKVE